MLGTVSNYCSEKHCLIGGEIGCFIAKLAKESKRDLFVVKYIKPQTFVICEWLSPNRDIFIDIMNLGKSLANFDRKKAVELRHRLFAPITCNETSRGIAEEESNYYHGRQDENAEEQERLEKVSRGE